MGFLFRMLGRAGRPRFRRWRRWVVCVALLLGLAWAAPLIVARAGWHNRLLRLALADLGGTLSAERASLNWLSPVQLDAVTLADAEGRPVLAAPQVTSGLPLWKLLASRGDLGDFRCERPTVHVAFSGTHSNLEEVLSPLLARLGPSTGTRSVAFGLELLGARLLVRDEDTAREWALDPTDLVLTVPRQGSAPVRLDLRAEQREPGPIGTLELELSLHGLQRGAVTARAEAFPLGPAAPLARRLEPTLRCEGRATGRVTTRWGDDDPRAAGLHLEGRIAAQGFSLTGGPLGADRLALERLDVPCCLVLREGLLRIDRAEVACDVGRVSVAGTFDTAQSLLAALTRPGYEVTADLNLVKVARLLPATARLHTDVQVTDGRLQMSLRSLDLPRGIVWHGHLHTSPLLGLRRGKPIAWPDPIDLTFAIHQGKKALPAIEQVQCKSGFLTVTASGSPGQLSATGDYDLDRLATQLGQFVDLGAVRLAGKGRTQVTLQPGADGSFRLQAESQVDRLHLAGLTARPWQEESLRLLLEATGKTTPAAQYRLDSATLRLLAGGDEATLQLLDPVPDLLHGAWGNTQVRATGDLARWQRRLATATAALDGWRLGGQAELTGRCRPTGTSLGFEDARLVVREARCASSFLSVQEPSLELRATGRWQPEAAAVELQEAHLGCPAVAVHLTRVRARPTAKGAWDVAASASVQGDLARLQRWFPAATWPSLTGSMVGQADCETSDGRLRLSTDLTLAAVTFGPPAAPTWREPRLRLIGRGALDAAGDNFSVESLRLEGTALTATLDGSLTRLHGPRHLALAGQLQYDLERLAPLFRPYLGDGVRLVGRDTRPLRLEGPLAPTGKAQGLLVAVGPPPADAVAGPFSALTGEASLAWKSATAYGFQAGPAECPARLAGGVLRLGPIESTVNEGRLRVEPSLRLDPAPAEWTVVPGTVLDRVKLTPGMCSGALGHIAPVLAGVTEAEGQFSLALDAVRVPAAAPRTADVGGRLTLHTARIGPNALVRQFSVLLNGPATATLQREAVVPFRLLDGRVHHRDLELVFPELTIRTYGSVGLDGSLALVAEMPVPPKWVGNRRLGQALAKQTIRLPIGGTLEHPRLDEKVLRAVSAQFLRDTAGEVLQQEINKQVERLLKPNK